jgi:hypothetical protein
LIGGVHGWDNFLMDTGSGNPDSFVKLADALRELEVTVGPQARPVIAEVRTRLAEASALRSRGDADSALESIRLAMTRLAALAASLDPAEGALMMMIANRFAGALNLGDNGTAKETVNFIRHRAGDPKDDPDNEW